MLTLLDGLTFSQASSAIKGAANATQKVSTPWIFTTAFPIKQELLWWAQQYKIFFDL